VQAEGQWRATSPEILQCEAGRMLIWQWVSLTNCSWSDLVSDEMGGGGAVVIHGTRRYRGWYCKVVSRCVFRRNANAPSFTILSWFPFWKGRASARSRTGSLAMRCIICRWTAREDTAMYLANALLRSVTKQAQ
jgi:hypothetical protein